MLSAAGPHIVKSGSLICIFKEYSFQLYLIARQRCQFNKTIKMYHLEKNMYSAKNINV